MIELSVDRISVQIEEYLDLINRKNEINHVYVSHSHEDHVGSLHAFDDGVTQIHANEMTRKELLDPQKIGEFFDGISECYPCPFVREQCELFLFTLA